MTDDKPAPPMAALDIQGTTREELRESFRLDALHAWEEYKQTGLHLTLEEVNDWLSKWGTDELPPPSCHV
ncbi:hypothetical protein [Burkholderia orbicola]|jgi:predicted transcriptional regulator|uniref:Transcriptional regulator n=1 Tax=Burkholderia orbicola TaxID=2978683 RepID=A0ABT8P2A3_9BURK|nr:hypothetical protein [Burkholderia orbicola]MDN7527707.1 hypothetical protein [Burkholderia orbicola]